MKIFRDKTDYDGTVVALGNFDGLHIAHMTIIRNLSLIHISEPTRH